ncbi:hypothetical protein E1B28_010802 [Marasmius oreades]|uniref:NodB homology domain-containing protein n=1 Tax=Marasmius oreades TaxID=181124 RepID=A0A9P7RTF9_9AGAR|nr:uncharacterized protein E1B28_010802 [Marasmius oreades]KAG7089093.1 hypothetical protein E1B28_010802 [Marasmius oreades]
MQLKSFVLFALSVASFVVAVPNAESKRQAVPLAAVYTTCVKPRTIAFTFDDGPHIYNYDILEALKKVGAKGTFFLNGNNWNCIYDLDQTVRNIHSEGHQIGSHTWSHPNLKTLKTKEEIIAQLQPVDDALMKIVGVKPAMMRPPYGEYNDMVRAVAASRGQSLVNWDFDSGDSIGLPLKDSVAAYDALLKSNQSTIIALNHETSQTTAQKLIEDVMPKFKAAGYTLDTVAGCLGLEPYQNVGIPGTRDASWTCTNGPK